MRASAGWSWLGFVALCVACGADKGHAGAAIEGSGGTSSAKGGATSSGGRPSSGGSSSTGGKSSSGGRSVAGSAGDDAGGEAGSAGAGGDAPVTPPTPTVCLPQATWGAGTRLALSTAGVDVLGGVTPDELSLVFMSDGHVWVSDRDSLAADFSPAQAVTESGDYFAQVTLSPDGLTLVGVRLDGTGFGQLTRAARGARFEGAPDESPFDSLYGAPAASYSNGPFADPVFSANGMHLFYCALELESNASVTLYDAREAGGIWPWGSPVLGALLYSSAGAFRRPTAISSDLRTLFYWDEAAHEARVTWRSRVDAAFSGSEALGAQKNAVPNRACDRLYYAAPGSAEDDLFVSERD
jgi:hypothetical protein